MSSPLLWGPNNLANNLENGQILSGGTLINQNGSPNYCTFGNFANGLSTGWSLGAISGSLTNGIPVTGTNTPTFGSGSTGLSIPIVSSSQSAQGSAFALKYTATSATTVGNMLASDPLTLPTSNQANVVTFKGYFNVISLPANGIFGGTSGDSFGVAFWDVTNSAWIGNTSNFPFTQTTGVGFFTGTFQPSITTTQVRLVIYNVNATSGAIAIDFTDFYVGPVTAPLGAVVTDSSPYTPTFVGAGTVTAINARYRRVGDSIYVGGAFTTGTATATTVTISLPNGITSSSALATNSLVGYMGFGNAAAVSATVLISPSSTVLNLGLQSSTVAGLTPVTGGIFANNTVYSFFAEFPVTGWSSNVQMSNDTDTRVVAMQVLQAVPTAAVTGSFSLLKFTSAPTNDTHGAFSASTGLYTVPVTGYYRVTASCTITASYTSGAESALGIFQNGTTNLFQGATYSPATYTGVLVAAVDGTVYVHAGDTISPFIQCGASGASVSSNPNINYFTVERLSGPSIIAATESVNGRYFSSTSTVTSSLATIIYATKGWDTHNAYNVSTGIWTAPVSGKYQFNASAVTTGTYILNNAADIQIQQTGSSSQISEQLTRAGGAVAFVTSNVSDEFYCLAGDTIKIQLACGATGPTIAASNSINFFSWSRVGN